MKFKKELLLAFMLCISVLGSEAQVRPVNDYGAIGLGQLLRKLQTTGSVMMVGAHPDDEDSALLAYLARGENARTAYLSLTRGDGGQNIIGPELFEALGVIRTEELLQARRLDGAEQYFTRAFDYGFSKTLAEAKSKWPEDIIKCDVVHAIRLFRPLVVISRFTGTPQDGHGQHQYSGYITPIAVKAAADPQQCTADGEAWAIEKFYIESGFQDNSEPTLRINTGAYDPILGRTYFEIAMEGRSLHRSQGEGRIEFHGDSFSGLNLVGAAKDVREKDIFDGVKAGPAAVFDHPWENPDLMHPVDRVLPGLVLFYKEVRSHMTPDGKFRDAFALEKAAAAIRNSSGIQIDALANSETVVPGDHLTVTTKIFVPRKDLVKLGSITLSAPAGWSVNAGATPSTQNSREIATSAFVADVAVPPAAELTQPYWLRTERRTDIFGWPKTASQTLPFDPPLLVAHVTVNINGTDITFDQPVQYRFADPARGEIRREINVVPPVSASLDHPLLIVPISDKPESRHLTLTITNNVSRPVHQSASLYSADKLQISSAAPYDLKTKGDRASLGFDITVPAGTRAGNYSVLFDGSDNRNEVMASQDMQTIAYPHIQTHRYYTATLTQIRVVDLKTLPINVGYIMGSGDEVPEAIRQMGMKVTMLEEQDLASGDLSKFDTIVVGIRAAETRPDFVANKARLLDYVKNGGNMVVQYQRGNWTGIAPYPVNTQDKQGTTAGSINRVVDENAKVTILDPADPIFTTPNKITDADFAGWVQERNAYNLVTFDPQYKPLLESHDAGEQENRGGLVVAKVGKGTWAYCSYSFFRQLPAGVPGAYRLFANILGRPRMQ